jgi:hemolysin III
LQILDHVGIYSVIAGTYTPFLLITLNHSTAARILLVGQWMAAALGSTFAACSDLNSTTTNNVELSLFLLMGWSVVLVWPQMREALDPNAFFLLFLGGVTYVVGIAFFIMGERRPIYHSVWHIFVIIAASLHWFAIYFYVAPKPILGA